MTIRNLEYLFKPKSVALIDAGEKTCPVGAVLAKNLFNAGYGGPVMPVHPKHQSIEGVLAYPDIASLPVVPDLAVISAPLETVPGLISELAERGTRAAVIIANGFGDTRQQAIEDLEQQIRDAAKPSLMRIIGPDCLGIMVPGAGLNASFCHLNPLPGNLAFVAQSGDIVTSVADWASARNIGFSHMVSLGRMADVDFGDMMDYLANDSDTHAILLYIESIKEARKLLSAARAASRMKPVVVVRAGVHEQLSAVHHGAFTGLDAIYDAVFKRAGMLRVATLREAFDAVEILVMAKPVKGDRLAILTNGGGIGVMATDALIGHGGRLADLSEQTIADLDQVLLGHWSGINPVDIVGNVSGKQYAQALSILARDKNLDAVLVVNCPTAVSSGIEAARAIVDIARDHQAPLVLTSWLGEQTAKESRKLFIKHHIPTYYGPGQAVRAFMYLVNHKRSQKMLTETPPSIPEEFSPDIEQARGIIRKVLEAQREWLTEPEAEQVLSTYAIPVAPTRIATTPEEAATLATEFGGRVVLKMLSPDITQKSDMGCVALDLNGPAEVKERAGLMLSRVQAVNPNARILGFTVSPMIRRPGAYELMVGVASDPLFGPVVLFGHGGTAVEVIKDKSLGLPPLNMHLAYDIIHNTRIYHQLKGFSGLPAVNLEAIALTLIKLSQMVIDIPEIHELDINPLLVDEAGVIGISGRIKVRASDARAVDRLTIRPYPKELEETIYVRDEEYLLRPIFPEDEPMLQDAFTKLTAEQIRLRFFVPMKTLTHVMAARFTQIDYGREMALVLTHKGRAGDAPIFGVVHIHADPDNIRAEYDILVRDDMAGKGFGRLLMQRIISYCKKRGIQEVFADVLQDNKIMLGLCKDLGFKRKRSFEDAGVYRVTLLIEP